MTTSPELQSPKPAASLRVSPRGPSLLALGCAVFYAMFALLAYGDGAPHREPPVQVDGVYVDQGTLVNTPLGIATVFLVSGAPFVAIGALVWALVILWRLPRTGPDRATVALAVGALILAALVVSFALSPTMEALFDWFLD